MRAALTFAERRSHRMKLTFEAQVDPKHGDAQDCLNELAGALDLLHDHIVEMHERLLDAGGIHAVGQTLYHGRAHDDASNKIDVTISWKFEGLIPFDGEG
jgi:hypothetical protein